ncbi:hypothetical protein [Streptomyces sp. MST-110588]|uniref:hypothetical protein n=1 Tax=Streptomyces sp. MST-110588 TaxID=2833628 RepID=UPI0032427313
MPPPPSAPSGGGKKTALIIGAVAVVAAIGVGAYFAFGPGGDVAPYKIALPKTLLGGEYTKQEGKGSDEEKSLANDKDAKAMGITDGKSVGGRYLNGQKAPLGVAGIYGKVSDPQGAVDKTFLEMEQKQQRSSGAKVESPPATEYSPSGFDGAVMKCKAVKVTLSIAGTSMTSTASTCMWGDSSAIGYVSMPTPRGGQPIPLEQLAEKTAKIRDEVRQEIK